MIQCAITEGAGASNGIALRRRSMLDRARRWAADGVDYVQLREKQLNAGDLLRLACDMLEALRGTEAPDPNHRTALLVNSRVDVAVASRAHGVHLTSHLDELTAAQVRALYARARLPSPVVSISCHTAEDVLRARDSRVDLILFGPVFEKRVHGEFVHEGTGIRALGEACRLAAGIPVLALGGVTHGNAAECLRAGAAGIASIRLFE